MFSARIITKAATTARPSRTKIFLRSSGGRRKKAPNPYPAMITPIQGTIGYAETMVTPGVIGNAPSTWATVHTGPKLPKVSGLIPSKRLCRQIIATPIPPTTRPDARQASQTKHPPANRPDNDQRYK